MTGWDWQGRWGSQESVAQMPREAGSPGAGEEMADCGKCHHQKSEERVRGEEVTSGLGQGGFRGVTGTEASKPESEKEWEVRKSEGGQTALGRSG